MGSLNTTLHREIATLLLQQWFVIEIGIKVYRSNKSTVRHSQLLTDNRYGCYYGQTFVIVLTINIYSSGVLNL